MSTQLLTMTITVESAVTGAVIRRRAARGGSADGCPGSAVGNTGKAPDGE